MNLHFENITAQLVFYDNELWHGTVRFRNSDAPCPNLQSYKKYSCNQSLVVLVINGVRVLFLFNCEVIFLFLHLVFLVVAEQTSIT